MVFIVCDHCGAAGEYESVPCPSCGVPVLRCKCGHTYNCRNGGCGRLDPYKANRIYNEDCIVGMSKLPPASVDLIIADTPFGIKFDGKATNYNRKSDLVIDGYGEVPPEKYLDFTMAWLPQAINLLKDSGSMYIVSGWNNLELILRIARTKFIKLRNHIIWKYQFGAACQQKYVTSHYHILYFVKDEKKRHWKKRERYPEDVWYIKRKYHRGEKKTSTRLPVALVQKMISFSSYHNDLIFDPFLGSGTTAAVAKRMFRQYLGFELVPEYFQFAQNRLDELDRTWPKAGDPPSDWILEEWDDDYQDRYEKVGS